MKTNCYIILLILFSNLCVLKSQVIINRANTTATSLFDIRDIEDNRHATGFQTARLTLAQLTAKGNSLYGTKQTGALIYIIDVKGGGNVQQRVNIDSVGYYYFDGSIWQKLGKNTEIPSWNIGDITNSYVTADYEGWYILDGRNISTLPTTAKNAAISLGINSVLPDARERVIRMLDDRVSSQNLATKSGTDNITLTLNDLPKTTVAISISGSTNSLSGHTHTASGSLANGGEHSHTFQGSFQNADPHTHSIYGTLSDAGLHSHSITRGKLDTDPGHSHTLWTVYRYLNGYYGNEDVDGGSTYLSMWNIYNEKYAATSDVGNHTHLVSGSLQTADSHAHYISGILTSNNQNHQHSIWTTLSSAGSHSHTVRGNFYSAGSHTHQLTINPSLTSGGSSTPFDKRSAFVKVNTFIYLGK